MKTWLPLFVWLCLGLGSSLQAQIFVVGVRVSYTGGSSSTSVKLGDPINLEASGAPAKTESKQFELMVDDPKLVSLTVQNLGSGSAQIDFNPPVGYWMIIDGVRQTVLSGNLPGEIRITLVRRESAAANDCPIGEPSSIQFPQPSTVLPYIEFNLGTAKNGDAMPVLRIPMAPRTNSTANFVFPDTPEVQEQSTGSGGFSFSVPQAKVQLQVSGDNSGNFDLKFLSPGETPALLVTYHFQVLKPGKMRVEKELSAGGPKLETILDVNFVTTALVGNGAWAIEDWHIVGSPVGRVVTGTRASQINPIALDPDELRKSVFVTDTIEVKRIDSAIQVSLPASRTISKYNYWGAAAADSSWSFGFFLPDTVTPQVGDTGYASQELTDPNFENVHGTKALGGRTRIDVDTDTAVAGFPPQLAHISYDTWFDTSPAITGNKTSGFNLTTTGTLKTTVLREMDSRWVAFEWPKSIEKTVGTDLLAKTTISYDESTPTGLPKVVTAMQRDYSTSTSYVETITKRFRPDIDDANLRNRVYSVQSPGGAKQSFAYAAGNFPDWSADFRITILSGATTEGTAVSAIDGITIDSLQMHAGKSTKTVEYLKQGRLVRREVLVYTDGGGFEGPVAWETFGYTPDGRLSSRASSNGSSYSANWMGSRKVSQTDETGLTTYFNYDNMDRVTILARAGASTVAQQATILGYDADNRIVSTTRQAVTFSPTVTDPVTGEVKITRSTGEQIVSETEYDLGGRVKTIRQPGKSGPIETSMTYPTAGRDTQITDASGTKLTVRYTDGRTKDITGTAVVEEHYSYDFIAGGYRVTRRLGPITAPATEAKRPQFTLYDLLGRVKEEKINGFGTNGATKALATAHEYDATTGLLKKTFTVEQGSGIQISGDQIRQYNAFGQLKAAGLDLNSNGTLDAASSDRFAESDWSYVKESNVWYHRVTTKSYHSTDGGYLGSQKDTQLTLPAGTLARTIDYDAYNNATTRTVVNDTVGQTRRVQTKLPDSTTLEQILVGDTLAGERWYDDAHTNLSGDPVLSVFYVYDALGRRTYVKDYRKGDMETNYWPGTALPHEQYDARRVKIASYDYDAAGRLSSSTNPAGTVNYFYTSRGELKEVSGEGTDPSTRVYTPFGELQQLKTYRNELTGTADITEWTYDDNTGWLVAKTDPNNKVVSYDYEFTSQGYRNVYLHSARDPAHFTTHRYDLGTGDLLKILYADGTTDINFLAYDRLGNLTQVQDATGTRTLEYQNGQLTKETLPDWFNNLVVGIDYETTTSPTTGTVAGTVKGRYSILKLGTATEADREMAVTYGYDNFGRINGVKADYKARTSVRDALSVAASYQYTPRSSMWGTFTQGNFSVTRTPEPARDVLSSIASVHTAEGDLAIFGYGTDDAGRRQWAKQWGMAFGDFQDTGNDPTYYRYNYDAKGQLATDPDPNSGILAAQGYRGTDPTKADNPLPGRGFGYTYDSAGNRKTVSVSGDPVSYRNGPATTDAAGANALNQPRSRGTLKSRVSGTSDRNAAVTVGSITASREPSPGRYWDAALPTASDGQYASVTVSSTLAGATSETKTVQVLTRPANEELIWDDDGNLQKDSLWSYEYDAENRLKRMSRNPDASGWAPNRELLFTYDYLGRRVQKVAKLNNQTVYDRKYIYHGWALIAELDTATNKIVRSYAWGLDIDSSLGGTGGVGGLVLETLHTDTTLTAFHICYDGSGNVAALARRAPGTDADGQTAVAYEYGPFGEPLRVTLDPSLPTATRDELATQPFRFSTKYTDTETGLVYYGYRYYDPSLGRFINRDPIGEAGGNNLYGFVGNGPVNGWDFLGMAEATGSETTAGSAVDNIFRIPPPWEINDEKTSGDSSFTDPITSQKSSRPGKRYRDNEEQTGGPNSVTIADLRILRDIYVEAQEQWFKDNPNDYRPLAMRDLPRTVSPFTADINELNWIIEWGIPWATRLHNHYRDREHQTTVDDFNLAYDGHYQYLLITDAIASLGVTYATYFASEAAGLRLAIARLGPRARIFMGMEVRAVRDLSHVDEATLRAMADEGFAAKTADGDRIILHHHKQRPDGPIIEMPEEFHDVHNNSRQHPFGNQPGAGLTAEEREAFNEWRKEYWKMRAREELARRGIRVQ